MSTLLEIENAIARLPATDFRELRRWMQERDAEQWDNQIAADAAAGKFDELRRRVRADYEAGLCADL